MQQDTFIKALDKFFNLFNFRQIEQNPTFNTPKKVLIVMPDFLGDCVLLTSFIRNLKLNLPPNGFIDLVSNKPILDMLKPIPYTRRIYLRSLVDEMKQEFLLRNKYDTIFIFNYSVFWAAAAKSSNISQIVAPNLKRVGMSKPPILQKVLTHIVSNTDIKDKNMQLNVNLSYLEELGLEVYDYHPEIKLKREDIEKVLPFVNTDRPKAYIHVTAGSSGKEWSMDRWNDVLKYLDSNNFDVFASGTASEKGIYKNLEEDSGVKIKNLCGQTSVREIIALLRFMDLIITTDSAPAHFAALAQTPKIAVLYGPTNHNQWKPFAPFSDVEQIYADLPCRPCLMRNCSNKKCLNELSANFVIDRIDNLLTRKSSVKQP